MAEFDSNIYNRGNISFYVDDVESKIVASACSFTIRDSIYDLYPRGTFWIDDTWGYFNEYLGFVNGTKLEIKYGLNKDSLKSVKFRVVKNSTPELTTQGCAGGKMELSLIHDYFHNQTKLSMSYENNISDIIKQLAKKYKFNKYNIDKTLNSGIWHQPYVTDSDFIINYLLPYAYSTDSNESPFYCFIDNNNNFNLKNYKSLMTGNAVQTFRLKKQGINDSLEKDTIRDLHYAQISTADIKPYLNRTTSYWDENGDFVKKDNIVLTDFPKNSRNAIPLKANINCITDIVSLIDNDVVYNENINNRKGQIINPLSNVITTDKVIISINFNNDICAGDLVDLQLPSINSNATEEVSLRNSGVYLVESSYQKWDGLNFYTILVCSKQDVKLTKFYRNLNLVLNRD